MNSNEILRRYQITYRQLDSWTSQGYLGTKPQNPGTGRYRDYTYREVEVLERMIALVDAGVRPAVASQIAQKNATRRSALREALDKCE